MFLVLDKKRCMVISACIMIFGLAITGIVGKVTDKSAFGIGSSEELTVVIDAGHGHPDGGTVGVNGLVEADVNLKLAKMLAEILEGKGIKTIMTRSEERGVREEGKESWSKIEDMRIRQKILKDSDADLFISIHMNHFSSSDVHGLRLFYAANHSEIKGLAEDIQEKMSELTGAKVTAVKAADKSIFLMKSPPMPAILIECGFLSNEEEEQKLGNEEYLSKLAWAIADRVENHYRGKNEQKN